MARKPETAPRYTVTEFYRHETGDTTSHHRKIDGHLKHLSRRTQEMIKSRAAGERLQTIADRWNITRASANNAIERGIASIKHAIEEAPRYHTIGRSKKAES